MRDLATAIQSVAVSSLDYCSAWHSALKNYWDFHLIQYNASCLLTDNSKQEHFSPILKCLHWLPTFPTLKIQVLVLVVKSPIWHAHSPYETRCQCFICFSRIWLVCAGDKAHLWPHKVPSPLAVYTNSTLAMFKTPSFFILPGI